MYWTVHILQYSRGGEEDREREESASGYWQKGSTSIPLPWGRVIEDKFGDVLNRILLQRSNRCSIRMMLMD